MRTLVSRLGTWLAVRAKISSFTTSLTTSSKLRVHILKAMGYYEVMFLANIRHALKYISGTMECLLTLFYPRLSSLNSLVHLVYFFPYLYFIARLLTYSSLHQRACLQNHCL